MLTLSTVLVGDAAVTVRCGQLLLAAGHPLLGVFTGDGRVAAWAAQERIACCFLPAQTTLSRDDIGALLAGAPFDLLLSVHNLRILPPEVLALPRAMAINFHDAPLPRYAGMHATSWAIDHGETLHGIVWHRMTPAVDAGEVLVERTLAISPEETAWTLNIRSTEAAIDGFAELITGLAQGTLAPRVQDSAARTFFPGWRRPSAGCVVPWNESAERISSFVRALDFGAADNPLGLPKLYSPAGVFLVPKVAVLATRSGAPAGTLLRNGAEGLEVATATFDVRIPALRAIDGATIASEALPMSIGVDIGEILAGTAPAPALLAARERALHPHEAGWIRTLVELLPLVPPGFEPVGDGAAEVDSALELDLPVGAPGASDAADLAAAILAWLGEEIGQPFDVAFGEPELRAEIAEQGWQDFLVSRPPLRVRWRTGLALPEFASELAAERARRKQRGTYGADLPLRIRRRRPGPVGPLVSLDLLAPGEKAPPLPAGSPIRLALAVDASGRRITLHARTRAGTDPAGALSRRLLDWFQSPRSLPAVSATFRGPTVGERFRALARQTPQALALEWGDERWSYGRLAQRAGRLAEALARRGVGVETLVALRLPRLPDLVTAMLAVHEAGGAFLVLDALDSTDRVGRLLAETCPLLALADSGLHRIAPQLPVHPIGLADAREISPVDAGNMASRALRSASDLAYVAATSGSTGAPKGVAIEQGALSHYIDAAGRHLEITAADRILQLGSPAFDLALEQIFGALCHGATLVGLDLPSLPTPRELLAACDDLAISVLDPPTAVWEQASSEIAARALPVPRNLRLLLIGGEQASARAARVWLDATGGARLVNGYGPTEATIVATWWDAPRRSLDLAAMHGLPIGRPVEGVRALVLDPQRRPVADGEAGELWLGGPTLARGYHRRPDLTAARFLRVDSVPATEPGRGHERLYATGDRVRRRVDGELEFLGRLDRQVKIAGRRVEPGEVEATLRAIPGVVAAVVAPALAASLPGSGVRLSGWVVLDSGRALESVIAEVEQRLPSYLRPGPLVAVDALPLTRTGKVDVDRLRPQSATTPSTPPAASPGKGRREPPRNETEQRLAVLWERLLGSDSAGPIGRDADFFALGGDSLAAVSLLVEIEAAFGVPLRVAQLLRAPTIAGLATALHSQVRAPSTRGGGNGAPSAKAAGAPSSLVTIVPAASPATPAIFCVHGLGGHLLRQVPLARALAPERVLIGLQSPGLDDDRPIPETVAELAGIFLAEIRAQAIPPPYRLAGMSFGGIVAFEMARLAKPGEIASISMFDTELAEVLPDYRPAPLSGMALFKDRLRRFAGDGLGRLRRAARNLTQGRDEVLKANEYRHFTRVMRANEAALARYVPGAGAGVVTFFAATARTAALYQEFMRLTGCELAIVPVPGDHLSMLEPPHVDVLAAALERLG